MLADLHIPDIQLQEELGFGAYSIVYRAQLRGAPCAVKIPRIRGRWTKWVYREAVALARVRHFALPRVLEVGEVDDLPYLVMELVEGETLADRLGREPVGEELTLTVAQHVASALAAVHDTGLVHRDVKPRNIVLERGGRVRLIDFGFATPIERIGQGPAGTAGSPAYAAPEQLSSPPRVDGRTDLYSLGRVLDECLTGRLTLVDSSKGPPAQGALRQIVRSLVKAAPDDRYPDARALLSELDRHRQGRALLGPGGYRGTRQSAAFIGRGSELERLKHAWSSVGLATGAVAMVRGARGSGKSRLLATHARHVLESGARHVLEVTCLERDPPLATLRRILEAFVASLGRASAEERIAGERALRAAAAHHLAPYALLISPGLSDILGPSAPHAEAASEGFAEGALELLLRLVRLEGPLAISVDDAQWLDPASRDVLSRLAHRADSAPLLLLLAARPTSNVATIEGFATLDPSRLVGVELAAFDEPQIAALVASHLGIQESDRAVVHRIAALGDGTPLGALEVLGALLDAGALRPHAGSWTFDAARAERVSLPTGALALLGRRLRDVAEATRRVLQSASLLGGAFDDALLAGVVGINTEELGFALAEARRAGILESEGKERQRFVHDSLRDMLESSLNEPEKRGIHQRIAEILDAIEAPDFDTECRVASHYARGDLTKAPKRAYQVARRAATAALDHYDNESALRFLDFARAASDPKELATDTSFFRCLGEAQVRLGRVEDALQSLESALVSTSDPYTCAAVLERITWIHVIRSDPERAWASLDRAFKALGKSMPIESASSAARTLVHVTRSRLAEPEMPAAGALTTTRMSQELLCALHYENMRLGVEHGKPARMIQSALEGVAASQPLGPSRAQARAWAIHSSVLTILGQHGRGRRLVTAARKMASSLDDPTTETFCIQVESVLACFSGNFDRALELLEQCVDERGHWLELSDYCYDATTAALIESMRGRSTKAWSWIARAMGRSQRSHPLAPLFIEHLAYRAEAALAALGRDANENPWLRAQLQDRDKTNRSVSHLFSWGPRVRLLVESGNVGAEFEDLVRGFQAEGHNPRFVHPTLAEYYIAVAHGRLHQCLRSPADLRGEHLATLRAALFDLRKSARLPLFKAHRLYIEGCVAWLEGRAEKADAFFAEAEALAIRETCPWVLYGIARVRAHALKEGGRPEAARDQARIAETLALEHGSVVRAQWIRDELGLIPAASPKSTTPSTRSSRSSRSGAAHPARQQLAALLSLMRTPAADLRHEHQVHAVVDELVRAVDAERGLLVFEPEPETFRPVIVRRDRAGRDIVTAVAWQEALTQAVRATADAFPLQGEEPGSPAPTTVVSGFDAGRVIAVPLFLHGRDVGALILERETDSPPFALEERDLVLVLSQQVPISIELARLLAEREQLQASLLQAQKMEAVGQLASGVAHDFGNMLAAIRSSIGVIGERGAGDSTIDAELEVVTGAIERAGRLMRRLLGFSQDRPSVLSPTSVNDLIADLGPMLERIVGNHVTISLDLDADIELVNIDRAALEQVLINLVMNARDAMPDGGSLSIATKSAQGDYGALRRSDREVGERVVIEVGDTGHGIAAEHLPRIFDPFFTTKAPGAGSGIGLTTAYAFAKRSGGQIAVTSGLGQGTTVHLSLPKASEGFSSGIDGPEGEAPPPAPLRRGQAIH